MADNQKKVIFTETQVLRRNLLITFVLVLLLLALYVTIPGYNFAIKDVAIHNKELMDHIEVRRLNANLPELTLQEKRFFKIADYWYIDYLRRNTPSDAVVLLPPKSVIADTSEFNQINDAEWMEYFLFPRLCISEDEKDKKKELYSKVNYVAIVNGWGYDKLHYVPSSKPTEGVLPVERPKIDSAQNRQSNIEALRPQFLNDTTLNKAKTNVRE